MGQGRAADHACRAQWEEGLLLLMSHCYSLAQGNLEVRPDLSYKGIFPNKIRERRSGLGSYMSLSTWKYTEIPALQFSELPDRHSSSRKT